MLVSTLLGRLGYKILEAPDGVEALEMVREQVRAALVEPSAA
jgi:CheY-like chemotaxis protein